jgi:hypothetical protein
MLIPVLALLACEADLTLGACAMGLGLRHKRNLVTFVATGVAALGFVAAVFGVWAMWFVAPGCIAEDAAVACINGRAASGLIYLGPGAVAQWAWMLGIALAAKRVTRNRRLAHISG